MYSMRTFKCSFVHASGLQFKLFLTTECFVTQHHILQWNTPRSPISSQKKGLCSLIFMFTREQTQKIKGGKKKEKEGMLKVIFPSFAVLFSFFLVFSSHLSCASREHRILAFASVCLWMVSDPVSEKPSVAAVDVLWDSMFHSWAMSLFTWFCQGLCIKVYSCKS